MPLNVVVDERDTRRFRHLLISCEVKGCRKHLTDAQIAKGGGLLEMGWLRRFNSGARRNEYFCPEHKLGA